MKTDKFNLTTAIRQLERVDWDFALTRSQSAFSSLHWYPCRYPSQIPAALIGALSAPSETVLDPFLGSGTTAVEAQRLDRRCIGIELNPVAALMSKAKTLQRDADSVRRIINKLRVAIKQSSKKAAVPSTVQASKWYTPRTVDSLRRIRYVIDEMRGDGRVLAEAAFSAILFPVCRETRHWGYVCDNTDPKEDYERDVFDAYEKVLASFDLAYGERDEYWSRGAARSHEIRNVTVLQGDALHAASSLKAGIAHLIVTSPPYFGVADYVKAQRLSLEWQGIEIEDLRQQEIGARSKRRRQTASEEYLADCEKIFGRCRELLRPDRACAVVFGESATREPMNKKFETVLEKCGFKLRFRASRKISSGRRLTPSLQKEHLLVFT